jgi:hypothetical protein
MTDYKVGDRVEELNSIGEVIDRGTVTRIDEDEIWCRFDSNKGIGDYYFDKNNSEFFRLVDESEISVETVRKVLKAYQEYAKVEFLPEYTHQEVHSLIKKRDVRNSQEFKDFREQYEKFKEYL